MKFATIVGARPQFIKAAPMSRLLRQKHVEVLIHTGQHYDKAMSAIFFDELQIPDPNYNLGIGSGLHGAQTGAMLVAIEKVLVTEAPDVVIVYGDTNSTLAGALAAVKLHIPVAHIEAGLRSFNRRMPEEINRVLTDHISQWLFCPTQTAIDNLSGEGISNGVHLVGDVMVDAIKHNLPIAAERSDILQRLGLAGGEYYLATVHRPRNTDNRSRLTVILKSLESLDLPVVLPAHPRTICAIKSTGLSSFSNLDIIPPVSYLDMIVLESNARTILTDSGGVQKEAYLVGIPCVTLREETEWRETVSIGWNQLVGADPSAIWAAVANPVSSTDHPPIYGDGNACEKIISVLIKQPVTDEHKF
jgi:UDP-N-acetylglucosamine 2-epimerase (non-hydrolysing)/UDP-GlcNAc3NAcA epimerase